MTKITITFTADVDATTEERFTDGGLSGLSGGL